ncbi:MAG: AraC family transcriptional regulator, partial [Bacillota bacterium]
IVLFFNIDKKKYDIENVIFMFDPYFYQYHNQEEIKQVKTYLLEAALHQMTRKKDYEQKVSALIGKCLDVFVKRYQMQFFYAKEMKESMYRDNQVQLDRLQRINDYLYTYFKDKISLDTLAEMEHINKYYLSHLIKYSTGCSFQEIVNIIRTEVSEILLLSTNLSIDDIVHETGFSSYRFFNKHFKNLFHMTPSEYRKKYKNEILGKKVVKSLEYTEKETVEILENYLQKERNHLDQPKIAVDINACLRKISSSTEMMNRQDIKIAIPDDQSAHRYLKGLEGAIDPAQIVGGKSDTGCHNFLNDTDFMCCYLIKRLINGECLNQEVLLMDAGKAANHFFHGKPGLIASNGLMKSAFYAWYFYFLLGNEIIEKKNNYIVTRSPVGIQILFFYDYKELDEIEKLSEKASRKTVEEWIGMTQSNMSLKLELSNLDENCIIRRYHYHSKHGAYNQFIQMGSPSVIRQKDIELINKTSFPEVIFAVMENKGSAYEFEVTLEPFDAELITIEKIAPFYSDENQAYLQEAISKYEAGKSKLVVKTMEELETMGNE